MLTCTATEAGTVVTVVFFYHGCIVAHNAEFFLYVETPPSHVVALCKPIQNNVNRSRALAHDLALDKPNDKRIIMGWEASVVDNTKRRTKNGGSKNMEAGVWSLDHASQHNPHKH